MIMGHPLLSCLLLLLDVCVFPRPQETLVWKHPHRKIDMAYSLDTVEINKAVWCCST